MPQRSTKKRATSRGKRSGSKPRSRSSSRGGKLRLVKISKSPKAGKKLRAVFSDGSHTDFGSAGMSDFTKHKDDDTDSGMRRVHQGKYLGH